MKGFLKKENDKWIVKQYADKGPAYREFPLHPRDVYEIESDARIFDNIEARVAAYPDVEFEIVDEFTHPELYLNVGWGDGIKFAKLISNI